MNRCIIASDSFKGSLTSSQICEIAENCIHRVFPDCDIVSIPIADGGEGTAECFFRAIGGEWITAETAGPYMEPMKARYLRNGELAVFEMATAAGLPLVGTSATNAKNPTQTTTFGVGLLIKHAIEHGAKRILLGLGGSCTNDGGCGCAAAMGVMFTDENAEPFVPTGGTLDRIRGIDLSAAMVLLEGIEITAICDIENPLHGVNGAAYVFAPQKGADANMVAELDLKLKALEQAIERYIGLHNVADISGSGAAGGFGAGVIAFMNGSLKPGIDVVLDTVGFDAMLEHSDVVFTGEGRLDAQSMGGKAVQGVSRRARKAGVPVFAVVGGIEANNAVLYDAGITAVFSINRKPQDLDEAIANAAASYGDTIENICRVIKYSTLRTPLS